MKIQQRFTAEAEAAAARYGILVESWRHLFDHALNARDFGSPAQFTKLDNDAYDIARRFVEMEAGHIDKALFEIASEARTQTLEQITSEDDDELPDDVSEHLNDALDYLRSELSIQIERDINFLKQSLRKVVLQVTAAARGGHIPVKTALIQYRIGNAQQLDFFFHDRRSQKWASRKFVRAVWRLSLLSAYNEVVLLTLAEHGIDKAEIDHLDPKADSVGMLISMSSGTSMPSYLEIRNEIFHPNSDAILIKARA